MRGFRSFIFAACGVVLAGCASSGGNSGANDPYESTNRQIFDFNMQVDKAVLKPAADGYIAVVPQPARDGIHNFLVNLDAPIVFANDIFQGEPKLAGDTLGRFAINTTLGIGGILDPASDIGIPYHDADFGQTLGIYGVDEGPYIVLPFLGPDPPRDIGGQVVDVFLDPFTYVKIRGHIYYSIGRGFFTVLDVRSRNLDVLSGIERSSVDYYASVRSLYRQRRENAIRHGAPDVSNLPNL